MTITWKQTAKTTKKTRNVSLFTINFEKSAKSTLLLYSKYKYLNELFIRENQAIGEIIYLKSPVL
jgi:hypothetical protein